MKFDKNNGINWLRFAGILAVCWMMQPTVGRGLMTSCFSTRRFANTSTQPPPITKIPYLSKIDHPLTYEIPSYVRFDSSIFYRRENWRMQLNFRNLFNTEYYLGSPNSDRLSVITGTPFSIVGTISVQF
ncbi:MAG: hypothetical protein V7K89_03925 [Nostoc sp.]|uniref:hypothetical protein n=1 Tax=Nostoc sp. TaxID=1180 RepID=UPI002FF472F2